MQTASAAISDLHYPSVSAPTPKSECSPTKEIPIYDVIDSRKRLSYRSYVIRTRRRIANGRPHGFDKPAELSYVTVTRGRRPLAKFDSELFFPPGNSTQIGLYDLLGNGSKQLIVSQDIPKTGVQWVADFSEGFRVIFDGHKWNVGRESTDFALSDLDGDGVLEISTVITAFYGFENWRLSTSETPLPEIIFKYDSKRRQYFPANPQFKSCLLQNVATRGASAQSVDHSGLGQVISATLDYIFAGEESRGWEFFKETCTLSDNAKIEADIKKELGQLPVYLYIRRQAKNLGEL
jgi:hypothetical protein